MKFSQGKIVNLVQGSKEWQDLRAKRFTASEAPAMMGAAVSLSAKKLL
jgi:predicted phage-related endonuclease